jgi:leucyl aminopeptidase (aminopeptidase T)
MRSDPDFDRVLERALQRCLAPAEGEELLVLADLSRAGLAERVRAAGARLGARSSVMLAGLRDSFELPPAASAALAASDLFVALPEASISHTAGRLEACAAGARGAGIGGGAEEDVLLRLLGADLDEVTARSDRVAALLTEASTAQITCPRGTHLELDLRGRAGISDDGDYTARGAYGNLPFGEGFVSPVGGEGRLCPATAAGFGAVADDTVVEVSHGRLSGARGADGERIARRLGAHGAAGRNLAELGIGTHDRAHLTGAIVEDEKILGSIHVAFGASANIGGTVSAGIHVDCVVMDATVLLDGAPLLRDGQLLVADG